MKPPIDKPAKPPMADRSPILHLLLAALVGGAVAFVLSQLQFSLWIEPTASRDSAPPVIEVAPESVPQVSASPFPGAGAPKPLANGLRVRNASPHTVRVVLLSQQSNQAARPTATPYRAPIHWDFAPNEGSKGGLLLSLPEGNLTLQTGDVLVAFALDGSQRYWGPYVVGETSGLTQSAALEWQLEIAP
ncbi:hypothetical protein [Altericista sp. CCNU0014]|uniref:hypothetical protein n=1 Tax=Altericista sp. CCNU0014 TaxID=3082949 RepID=UPI00384C6CFA